MTHTASFLAVDLGASNGRVIQVNWDGDRFLLGEVHRFTNGGARRGSHLHWDVRGLWSQIQEGVSRFAAVSGQAPAAIGVDAWGVDYALLDRRGELLGDPYHYRDHRTDGVVDRAHAIVGDLELFRATGVQTMSINTVFQLSSGVLGGSCELDTADCLLMIPDLFQYFLSGEKRAEYTEATTTQLFDPIARGWAVHLLDRLGIPRGIFQSIVFPGTVLGPMQASVAADCGLKDRPPCIAVASHDTASAVTAIPGMDRNSVFLSSGTWSLMGILADAPDTSDEAFHLGFTNEGAADGSVLVLKNLSGLWILQECQRCWGADSEAGNWETVLWAAENAAPFRSLIDPSAAEFQSPANMLDAVRQFCGDTGQPLPRTLGEFARCVLESLALQYRRTVEDLRALSGRPLSAIRVVGGGALNRLLCQMTADACELPAIAGPVEAAALGNAILQAIAIGHLDGFAEAGRSLNATVRPLCYLPQKDDRWREAASRAAAFIHSTATP